MSESPHSTALIIYEAPVNASTVHRGEPGGPLTAAILVVASHHGDSMRSQGRRVRIVLPSRANKAHEALARRAAAEVGLKFTIRAGRREIILERT